MSTLGGRNSGGESCWSSAYDGDSLLRAHGQQDQLGLAPGTRIEQARGVLVLERVVQARLVASDAGDDLVRPTRSSLVDEVCVGEQWARHRHKIGFARR